jgi:hypothetical protein
MDRKITNWRLLSASTPKPSLELFPALFIAILLSPMLAAALIHFLSYFYPVPINFFSSVVFLLIASGFTFRFLWTFQVNRQTGIAIRNQYGTLLGLLLGLLPVFSALKLASSTIWEQRFNWLYFSNEDTATWVSLARATLQNGHVPQETSDSEYSLYGSASVLPGVLLRIVTSGKTASSHYEAVLMGVDAVLLSYLYAAVVAVTVVGAFLLVLPTQLRQNSFFVPLVLATSIGLAGASLFVAIPIAQGSFLSLSWAILGTFVALFFTYLSYDSKHLSVGIIFAIFITANFAVSTWPYLEVTYIFVSVVALIVTFPDEKFLTSIKVALPSALVFGGAIAAIKPFFEITEENTFMSLSSAQGLILERDQILIALAILGSIYILFTLKNKSDPNPAFPAFVVGSLFAAAVITFTTRQSGLLGEYGVAKLQYLGIAIAIISGLLYFANQIKNLESISVSLLIALTIFSGVTLFPQLSAITKWPSSFSVGGIGPPGDALKKQIRVMSESNFSCIPENDDSREKAYICNRWASALSSTNSNLDFEFRATILNDPRVVRLIIAEFRNKRFFEDRLSVPMERLLGLDTK